MKKQIFKIINLLAYIGFLLYVSVNYLFRDEQPKPMICLILILCAISVAEDYIKDKIKKAKK